MDENHNKISIEHNDDRDIRNIQGEEDRLAKVWDLKIRGVGVPTIAKAMDVSVATIYRDLKTIGQKYRDEIMQVDPLTLVAENLKWIDEMERVALYELSQADNQTIKTRDPATGVVTEQKVANPNKSKFYSAALKAREMKLRLLMDTKIIPTDAPDKMFSALEELDPSKAKEIEDKELRTEDDVKDSIAKLLKHGKML